jgi:small-conductance mechanosensitive channel
MNKYMVFVYGVLAGGVITAIGTQKLGHPLQPFARTTIVFMSVLLIAGLAGSAMASAHYLRDKPRQTISGDTYFKIIGISIIMIILALAITTELGRENLIAILGFLGTALGFVMGKTASGKASENAP